MAVIFKPIIPKQVQTEAMSRVLSDAMRGYGTILQKDFEKTVNGWKRTKPKFVIRFYPGQAHLMLTVAVTGDATAQEIWWYLEKGTRPHIIRPKNARFLRYKSGKYKAGSRPNSINTTAATPASGPDVYRNIVHHPGFPARNFINAVKVANERMFTNRMNAAMVQAARVSGHKI